MEKHWETIEIKDLKIKQKMKINVFLPSNTIIYSLFINIGQSWHNSL